MLEKEKRSGRWLHFKANIYNANTFKINHHLKLLKTPSLDRIYPKKNDYIKLSFLSLSVNS